MFLSHSLGQPCETPGSAASDVSMRTSRSSWASGVSSATPTSTALGLSSSPASSSFQVSSSFSRASTTPSSTQSGLSKPSRSTSGPCGSGSPSSASGAMSLSSLATSSASVLSASASSSSAVVNATGLSSFSTVSSSSSGLSSSSASSTFLSTSSSSISSSGPTSTISAGSSSSTTSAESFPSSTPVSSSVSQTSSLLSVVSSSSILSASFPNASATFSSATFSSAFTVQPIGFIGSSSPVVGPSSTFVASSPTLESTTIPFPSTSDSSGAIASVSSVNPLGLPSIPATTLTASVPFSSGRIPGSASSTASGSSSSLYGSMMNSSTSHTDATRHRATIAGAVVGSVLGALALLAGLLLFLRRRSQRNRVRARSRMAHFSMPGSVFGYGADPFDSVIGIQSVPTPADAFRSTSYFNGSSPSMSMFPASRAASAALLRQSPTPSSEPTPRSWIIFQPSPLRHSTDTAVTPSQYTASTQPHSPASSVPASSWSMSMSVPLATPIEPPSGAWGPFRNSFTLWPPGSRGADVAYDSNRSSRASSSLSGAPPGERADSVDPFRNTIYSENRDTPDPYAYRGYAV